MSEDYTFLFPQDLPLIDYLPDYKTLVGRKWLFEKFEETLLDMKNPSRGIISVADFGYGKSAIVSNLLCSGKQDERSNRLRRHTVAFHVCKYDVSSTQSPERFIRRLVGFFATKSPEYGNIISMLSNESLLYDLGKCANELDACFDQAFRFPLKKLQYNFPPWIIVIDALDECLHSSRRKNFILDLLSTRIQYFPKWIKFLITSRDITQLQSLRKLEIVHLLSNDSNNLKDVSDYITEVFRESEPTDLYSRNLIESLQRESEGNFLYVIHAMQYVLSSDFTGNLPNITTSLEGIYELNFDRQFERGNSFNSARLILEVICTALSPLQKEDIYTILVNSKAINKSYSDFNHEFQKLSFFVKAESEVMLSHKAIHTWLLSPNNERYHISETKGHSMISKHLLRTVKKSGSGDIIDLVIHISESKDKSLRKTFLSFNLKSAMSFEDKNILHKLIEKTKSEDQLDLLLSHHSNINILDDNGISPAFLAASKGHFQQLKLLIRRGADIRFVVDPCRLCDTHFSNAKTAVEEIKTSVYSGYGLLHIAVQHNFIDVVKYLIKETKISIKLENTIGQRPSDIACEKGYTAVLKSFKTKKGKSFGIDEKCLYFATRGQHLETVKYIIGTGVNPRCVTNKTSVREFNRIQRPCKCKRTHIAIDTIRTLDTFWLVFRESALHYAIRARYTDIAKYLIEKTNLSNCSDAYGYMPLLLSIKYENPPLVRMMYERALLDMCSPPSSVLNQAARLYVNTQKESVCPERASFAHLIAMYDRTTVLNVFESNKALKWNMTDRLGNRPIHYAASHGSIGFIGFMNTMFGEAVFEEQACNGSTAYHVAAISCSEKSFKALTNDFQNNIPDMKDYGNRSILQYSLMCENTWPENTFRTSKLSTKTRNYLSKQINITDVDHNGNNLLSYVLRFGHIDMLKYINITFPEHLRNMLYEENCLKQDPILYTLLFSPSANSFASSSIETIFQDGLVNLESDYVKSTLYPWEICLVYTLRPMSLDLVSKFFVKYFHIILLKSPFLTKAVLMKLKIADVDTTNTEITLKELIVKGIKAAKYRNLEMQLMWSLQAISVTMPNILHNCGQPLSGSPLHYIALNRLDTFPGDLIKLFKVVFKSLSNKTCCCSNGWNVLHYSLKGGNIPLANYLMSKNFVLINKNVSAIEVIHLAVSARRTSLRCSWMDQISCIDVFLSKFIKGKRSLFSASDFCTKSSNSLSLVHLFAVDGMNRTLKAISRLYGYNILHCSNFHNFTPIYFAESFGRQSTIAFLDKHTTFVFPNVSAEESYLLKILNNFPQIRKGNPFRCLTSKRMAIRGMKGRSVFQDYKCLHAFYKGPFLSLDTLFISNLVYFREGLYLTRKLMLKYLNAKRNVLHISFHHNVSKCSFLVKELQSCREMIKRIMFWSEIRNRYFSWMVAYPFLERITSLTNLSLRSKLFLSGYNIQTGCLLGNINCIVYELKHVEEIIKGLFQNLQGITTLISLIDQKSYMKSSTLPINSNFTMKQLYTSFGFSSCFNCPFVYRTDMVHNVNQFRYLNILKSTLTYKHVDYDRRRQDLMLSKRIGNQIKEKMTLMHTMMYKTKERQKWIARNIKNEHVSCNRCCNCRDKSHNISYEDIADGFDIVRISVPFI